MAIQSLFLPTGRPNEVLINWDALGIETVWERVPQQDRRFSNGDDWAGNAWRHKKTGEVHWTAVGFDLNAEPVS